MSCRNLFESLRVVTLLPHPVRGRPSICAAFSQSRRLSTPSDSSLHKSSSASEAQPSVSIGDWTKSARPTPYDILDLPRNAPYTKTRFRQLVKLYHPDLHSSPSIALSSISRSTRLERYHLIMQAHDVLSDPAKRRAYDSNGAHWRSTSTGAAYTTDAERYEAWRKGPYASCAQNGTWEDWERWYAEQANPGAARRSQGYYMGNGTFVVLIVFTVIIISIMQTTRHEQRRRELDARWQRQQAELSKSLMQSQHEVEGLDRQERVDRFLRHRENTRYAFQPTGDDKSSGGGSSNSSNSSS